MVPVEGDSRWCLWKGPTCRWGLWKLSRRQRHHHLILGQSLGNQNKHSHYSLTSPGQLPHSVSQWKKKAGCISISTPLRALLDTAHQVWHCLWQRLKTVPGNHQCLLQWGTGTLGHLWAMFMHVSTRNTGNRAPQLLLMEQFGEAGKFKHSHLSRTHWQPYTHSRSCRWSL